MLISQIADWSQAVKIECYLSDGFQFWIYSSEVARVQEDTPGDRIPDLVHETSQFRSLDGHFTDLLLRMRGSAVGLGKAGRSMHRMRGEDARKVQRSSQCRLSSKYVCQKLFSRVSYIGILFGDCLNFYWEFFVLIIKNLEWNQISQTLLKVSTFIRGSTNSVSGVLLCWIFKKWIEVSIQGFLMPGHLFSVPRGIYVTEVCIWI